MSYTGITDVTDLPPLLTTPEVLALARYGRAKLRAEQARGRMPQHVGRGGDGYIYKRDEVLKALGLSEDSNSSLAPDPWDIDPVALQRALSRPLRRTER